jgi:hypothetical protein
MGSSVDTVVSGTTAGIDQVADLRLRDAGDVVDWRNDARETKIDLSGFDGGLVGLNLGVRGSDCCFSGPHLSLVRKIRLRRIVEILLTYGIGFGKRFVLLYIQLALS